MDGILGMGFNDIAIPPGEPTVFDTMIAEQLVPAAEFSVFLSQSGNASDDSVLLFGGVDAKYFKVGRVLLVGA